MNKHQITAKITYLEEQLVSLNHFLPETYEYLMAELDAQRRLLAEIEVKHGRPASHAFLNYVLRKLLPWLLGLTLLGIGLSLAAMLLCKDPRYVLSAEFTAWCMPYMPLICVAALFTSAVNLSGRFGLAEIASSCLNICMILGLGFFGYYLGDGDVGRARWLCFGTLAGGRGSFSPSSVSVIQLPRSTGLVRDAADSLAWTLARPSRPHTSSPKARVAPMPIGTVRTVAMPKLRSSQLHTGPASSG